MNGNYSSRETLAPDADADAGQARAGWLAGRASPAGAVRSRQPAQPNKTKPGPGPVKGVTVQR